MNEKKVWSSRPSQVENIIIFLFGIMSLIMAIYMYSFIDFQLIISGDVKNIKNMGLGVLLLGLVCVIILSVWRFLVTYNTRYLLTSQRLLMTYGVLNKDTDTLELYRVKDFQVYKPLYFRIFGLGNLVMNTSDASDPYVEMSAIRKSDKVLSMVRHYVELCRVEKGVRALDVQ